jgi:membrane-associated phospholipid phosphatase
VQAPIASQFARNPSESAWHHQIGVRLRTAWPLKMAGIALGMAAFFAGYFWLLRHPRQPPAIMPLTAVDDLIAFSPGALLLYLSLWLYVSLAPALLIVRREMISYAGSAVALGVLGLGIFWAWPTAVPPADINWSAHPELAFLKSADAAGNACPSLHVAFAVLTACWLARLLRQMGAGRVARWLNWLWCAGILHSTIAIRQHVALDVIAGAVLGGLVAVDSFRWLHRPKTMPPRSTP